MSLGPVLFFFIFINDLPDHLNSKARMFADDCIVYREIKSNKDQLTLQEDLDTLAAWEQNRGMNFHPQKCNVLRVSRAKSPMTFSYRLKGTVLAEAATSKFLGVDLQNNLCWNQHISRVTKKANSMLGFLRRNLRNQGSSLHVHGQIKHRLLQHRLEPSSKRPEIPSGDGAA